nr:immunoglobulin light chain junction region [Mus musculus]NSL99750.1 immunoglobulin light chain junction region [Mus musculus]
CQQNYEDPLTF